MNKVIVILGSAVFITLIAWHEESASILLNLLITGHVPGTSLTIPFWAMITIYCLIITAIITLYVEDVFTFRRNTKALQTPKTRMPRRRYSHI